MDKNTRDSKLREEGINGLRIITRNSIPRTKRTVQFEINKGPENGDLRRYSTYGVIMPVEDYMISGPGRSEMVIREVYSEVKKMKKYALLDFDKSSGYANVRYVYSEGIDIEKMAEDEEYAKEVMSLLQESRLKQKEGQSYQLQTDTVYMGTIEAVDGGYRKAGINDYPIAVSMIDMGKEESKQVARQKYADSVREEEKQERRKEIDEFFLGRDDEEISYLFAKICDKKGENGAIAPQIADMLKKYFKEKEEEIMAKSTLDENDGDEEPEQ